MLRYFVNICYYTKKQQLIFKWLKIIKIILCAYVKCVGNVLSNVAIYEKLKDNKHKRFNITNVQIQSVTSNVWGGGEGV